MMLDDKADAPAVVAPAKFWIELNRKNLDQFPQSEYNYFKRTVATNSFTCLLPVNDPQIRFLLLNHPFYSTIQCIFKGFAIIRHHPFTWLQSYIYKILALLFWKFTAKLTTEGIVISETDYPILAEWKNVYWRQGRVQTHFFEIVLRMQL